MNKYAQVHSHRTNLLIHLIAVPFFIGAHLGLVHAIIQQKPLSALMYVGLAVVFLGLQRWGHALEAKTPAPFCNGLDFLTRLYTEQFYTFPMFVLSGGFKKNWSVTPSQNALTRR